MVLAVAEPDPVAAPLADPDPKKCCKKSKGYKPYYKEKISVLPVPILYTYEQPKYEAPKYEAPKYEAPKYEEPKYEEPKYEAPKEEPKYEAPKACDKKEEEPKSDCGCGYQVPSYGEAFYSHFTPAESYAPQYGYQSKVRMF